jgi:cytochrome c-type protein NapB
MRRTDIKRVAVTVSVFCFLLYGGSAAVAQKKTSEEDLGIRKGSLFQEETVKPEHGEYSKTKPGKSKKFQRAFENSPPLIPHDLTGMLPIAETNNMCLGCHMPDAAESMGATPVPKSHLVDFDTGEDLHGKLDNKRFNCMECHVPQVKLPGPIKNTFKGDFRNKESKTRSDLIDSLNEGVKAE